MSNDRRQASALAAGSLLNGVLTYAFFAVTTRALGAGPAAPVSVLWTYWGFAGAALTFPLQHWVTRSVTAHGGEGQVRAALGRIGLVVLGLSVLAGIVSWLLDDALFRRQGPAFPALVSALTVGSAFIGVVRGALAARGRFVGVATAVGAEGTVRFIGAVVLLVASVDAPVAYGIVLFAGQLVGLGWPSALRLSSGVRHDPTGSPVAFLGGSAAGQLVAQTILVGGPVLLAVRGGSAAQVTALFAGLALFRAPYTLALGVLPQLTARITAVVVDGRTVVLYRLRAVVLVLTAIGLPVVGVLATWLGPLVIAKMFGSAVRLETLPTTLVALGSTLAMANLVVTITILAHDRAVALLRSWAIAALAAVVVLLLDLPLLEQTCWAFVAAEAAAFVLLVLEEVRATSRLIPATARGA